MNTVYSKILKVTAHVVSLSILGQVQHTGTPSKGSVQERGQKAGLSGPVWVSFIAVEISALHFLMIWRPGKLIFMGGSRNSFSSIVLRSENKYFRNDMSYDFSCSKTTAGEILLYKPLLDLFSKSSPKFHFEGSDGWSSITVRCFAPAEVKASNPFWRE